MEFSRLFVSTLLFSLLAFGIFAFAISSQEENEIEDPIIENSLINQTYGDLHDQLGSMRGTSNSQKQAFELENPTTGFGSIILLSVVSSGKVFTTMVVGTLNTLFKLPAVILGVDPVIFSVLVSILLATIIVGLWILYKLGG